MIESQMEIGLPPKRMKMSSREHFMLKQRYAPPGGLRDLLDVGSLDYILHNGNTYEYIVYITSLLVGCPMQKITIYRCKDGNWRDDESDEWEKITADEQLKGGVHLWSSTGGDCDFTVKLTKGIIDNIDVDPIYSVTGSSIKGLSKKNTPYGSGTPTATPATLTKERTTPAPEKTPVGVIALKSSSKTESDLTPQVLQILGLPKSVLLCFIHTLLTVDGEPIH